MVALEVVAIGVVVDVFGIVSPSEIRDAGGGGCCVWGGLALDEEGGVNVRVVTATAAELEAVTVAADDVVGNSEDRAEEGLEEAAAAFAILSRKSLSCSICMIRSLSLANCASRSRWK